MHLLSADKLKLTSLLLIAIMLGACGGSNSGPSTTTDETFSFGTATLIWLPPTTNEDGSVLEDLAGYKLYYGISSNALTNVITINNPGLSVYVVEGLAVNATYYFAVKAIDFSGNESIFSNIVSKYIQNET